MDINGKYIIPHEKWSKRNKNFPHMVKYRKIVKELKITKEDLKKRFRKSLEQNHQFLEDRIVIEFQTGE